MSQGRWGIVLEWDERGVTCCAWACRPMQRWCPLDFSDEASAQEYIDEVLVLRDDIDTIATPRQFEAP